MRMIKISQGVIGGGQGGFSKTVNSKIQALKTINSKKFSFKTVNSKKLRFRVVFAVSHAVLSCLAICVTSAAQSVLMIIRLY